MSLSVMFTRSIARALLVNRVTRHTDNLPEDVLLEIFDAYRQLHELQPNYEAVWNSGDGWFKLAHVCLHWRRIVFSSSSRLQVHLLFTPHRSSSKLEHVLRALPRFPILFDYRTAFWQTKKDYNLAIVAIARQRSRVHGIAFRRPCPWRVLKALSHPFPMLESLELESYDIYHVPWTAGMDCVVTLLSGSAPSLRRLTLQEVTMERLFPLLSSATALEELSLTLWVPDGTHPVDLLIANLQHMSCLRRLELKFYPRYPVITTSPNPSPSAGEVSLPRLTDFIFAGYGYFLQILTTWLAAPSLQCLDVDYTDWDTTFLLPQLCKYICDSKCQFKAIHLDASPFRVNFSAETRVKSDHAQPAFKISMPAPIPWEQIGYMLSGPLSTVEEFIIGWIGPVAAQTSPYDIPWRALFMHIPHVKMLRVNCQVALPVADAFQLNGREPVLDLLPSLEHVEVQTFKNIPYAPSYDVFGALIAARQQAGRPIKISTAIV